MLRQNGTAARPYDDRVRQTVVAERLVDVGEVEEKEASSRICDEFALRINRLGAKCMCDRDRVRCLKDLWFLPHVVEYVCFCHHPAVPVFVIVRLVVVGIAVVGAVVAGYVIGCVSESQQLFGW